MTSNRPYRRALSHEEAVEEIERESGRQFCPDAAGALLRVLEAQVAPTPNGSPAADPIGAA